MLGATERSFDQGCPAESASRLSHAAFPSFGLPGFQARTAAATSKPLGSIPGKSASARRNPATHRIRRIQMNRILKAASLMVLTLLLSLPGSHAQADTTTSGGQALVPPFYVDYISASYYSMFTMNLANVSNDPIHVVIDYYKQSGEIVKTVEIDLAAKQTIGNVFNGSETPNQSMFCYGVIRWTGPSTLQKPLLAQGYSYYYYMDRAYRNYEYAGVPINGGMPF
jgi:hypothetical protein